MSKIQPYSPIREPQKHVSYDRMQEILKSRSGNAANETQSAKPKEAQSVWPSASKDHAPEPPPPRSAGKLKWQPREEGSMGQRDTSEWYSVCEIHSGERGKVVTFEAWTRNPLTGGMTQLAVGLTDYRDARKIAQADADAKALAQQDSARG